MLAAPGTVVAFISELIVPCIDVGLVVLIGGVDVLIGRVVGAPVLTGGVEILFTGDLLPSAYPESFLIMFSA